MASTHPSTLRKRVSKSFKARPSLTKQAFREDCEINTIMKRFETTGQLPDLIKKQPQYGDFSSPVSYQDSLNLVLHAQDQFSNLSSTVRARFNNDPVQFLKFTADPKNIDEMVNLGLATKRQKNQTNNDQSKDSSTTIIDKNKESAQK